MSSQLERMQKYEAGELLIQRIFKEKGAGDRQGMWKRSFVNWKPNGVQINFPNGNWLSTVWGWGAYGDWSVSRNLQASGEEPHMYDFLGSNTCEVMFECGDKLNKRLHSKFNGDGTVIGYLTFDEWLYIVNALANEKKEAADGKAKEVGNDPQENMEN